MLCVGVLIIYANFNQMCYVTYVKKQMEVVILLDHLRKAMKMVDGNIIFKNHTFLTRTVGLALKFLQSPVSSIQLNAYHVLKHAVPKLVEQDKNTIRAIQDETKIQSN